MAEAPLTFDERASTWDTPDRVERARETAALIRANVSFPSHASAIELGAGTGLLGLELADEFEDLLLTDGSTGMLEVAQRKLREPGYPPIEGGGYPSVRVMQFELLRSQVRWSVRFDVAFSQLVLHHIEDTAAALRAMRDLLRPGGLLLAVDLDSEDGSFHDDGGINVHHLGFDRAELARLAAAAGFVDVEIRDGGVIRDADAGDVPFPMFLLTARRA